MLTLDQRPPFLCIGHRGAAGHAPENTLRSIALALSQGAPWVEVDVYAVENTLVVIHDDTLERTTNGSGAVMDTSLTVLRALDAGLGERIPTLDEVFDLCAGRAGVNIELKGPDTAAPVARFLADRLAAGWPRLGVLVSSFDLAQLETLRALAPDVPVAPLFGTLPEDGIERALRLGATSINLPLKGIDDAQVEAIHAAGLRVFVYTVNAPEDLQRLRAMGVDGVFSDYPDRATTVHLV